MASDKNIERNRYDSRARELLSSGDVAAASGSDSLPIYLRAPYLHYEKALLSNITGSPLKVLEIGAGTGAFTETLLKTGARVCASDISADSLEFIKCKFDRYDTLHTQVADMESLPFDDASFDVVTSAGSLSYGDPLLVLNEIYRVLKVDGKFICVDSLNHNIVYRFNRWLHFLRGNRTSSTLQRMPTMATIEHYKADFGRVETYYFGSLCWAAPLLTPILGNSRTARFLDWFDRFISVKRSAFKFVMIAQKTKYNR